jgi:hypothetical protein
MARSDWMAEVSSAWAFMLMKFGIAINIRMIMMDITISSSIKVKPRWRLLRRIPVLLV